MNYVNRASLASAFIASALFALPAGAAPVTNMNFVGGCPSVEDDAFCFNAGNATETNVALVLGVSAGDVTQITTGYTIDGIGTESDNWSISDSSITHLAFKADGYYILGKLTGTGGVWSSDVLDWTPDYSTLICPVGICNPAARAYELADFRNGGGNVADLSNVRAFSVVPIPAAVWLFGSALGLLGYARRRTAS